jgi:FkbM family methyltransferase
MRHVASLNSFHELSIERCAVGDHETAEVEFFVSESTWFSSLDRTSVERFEPAGRVHVAMVTLDAYCQAHKLVPDCVKIDVEGKELAVVRGARRVIAAGKPDLVIEVSKDAMIREAIWEQLNPLGYAAFFLATSRGGGVLYRLSDLAAFVDASTGHVDAVFTADAGVREWLEASPMYAGRYLRAAGADTNPRA